MPRALEAAILSRMRSPVTSRSNCAKESSTFSVSRRSWSARLADAGVASGPRQRGAQRDTIFAQLEMRRLDKPAFAAVPRDIARRARWVKPELVAEVTYSEVTPDGSLRHPSFKGMRENKRADQVVMELPRAGPAILDPSVGKEIAGAVGVKLTHPDKP